MTRQLTVMIPRAELAEVLPNLDLMHARALGASDAYGSVLRDHVRSSWRHAHELSVSQLQACEQGLLTLVAAAFPLPPSRRPLAPEPERARLGAIKTYIQSRIASPGLSPQTLCKSFSVSRATLYRWFEAEGGIASYLQRSRLRRASRLLASNEHRHLRVLDVAIECGFASDATFIRAFRNHFGVTPGEARYASQRPIGTSASDSSAGDASFADRIFAQVG